MRRPQWPSHFPALMVSHADLKLIPSFTEIIANLCIARYRLAVKNWITYCD